MKKLIAFYLTLLSIAGFAQNFVTNNGIAVTSNATVVVKGNWMNSGALTLSGGSIQLPNTTDTLTLNIGTTLSASNNAYIDGIVQRYGTGDLLFPLGRSSNYLPITFFGVTGASPRVSASISSASANYTAGSGVAALINFPYVWLTSKRAPADTATNVQVEYPSSLSVSASNPIVVRKVSGQLQYRGIRNSTVTNASGRTAIKTASGVLKGTFSVANGMPNNQTIMFDSLADKTLGDVNFTATASSNSGLPVSFTTASDKITITGNQIALVKAGRVTITAAQNGDSYFNAASSNHSFCISPPKPAITLSGANTETVTLTSSNTAGNQWFLNGSAITNATSNTLSVTQVGVYKVQTKVDDCLSQFSSDTPIIVTGEINPSISEVRLYPNPVISQLEVIGLRDVQESSIVSAVGSESPVHLKQEGNAFRADVNNLPSGLYILHVRDQHNYYQLKFIKK